MRQLTPVLAAGVLLLTLTFARVDADTIGVTVSGGVRDYHFNVSRLGTH